MTLCLLSDIVASVMSITTDSTPNEQMNSREREPNLARIRKVRDFIQDVLKPVYSTLGEAKTQQEELKKFESRPYQLEAWDALWQAREAGKDRGLIHLATGLGKTSVAVFDYAKFRTEQEAKGETARALFVVHQNAILDQADERFNEVLPHLLPGVGMSRFVNQADSLPTGEVVFASFQALNRGVHKFAPDHFDYIVYDEAHHIEAKTYKRVVEHFTPKFQLGLTATPERGDEKDITEHFGKALYTKTLPEGIAEEYLAHVHYRLMLDEQTKHLLQGGFKPKNMAELNRIFDLEPRLSNVAEAVKLAQQEIREATGLDKVKTIIFGSDLFAADEIARLMGGESYHSGRSNKDNKQILKDFRDGELETIVTRDMFNEGVDIPDARLVVFFRSTQSKTIFEQQLGRGLRKTDGKDEVTVLDFVANAERIRLLRELAGEVRSKRGGVNGGEGGGRGLIIGAGKSDFEFDQQLIDILDLYEVARNRNVDRVDWSEWSDDDLIQLALSISPDQALTVSKMDELSNLNEFPYARLIHNRFGSVVNFQIACGFELKSWAEYSDEELVQLALSLSPNTPISASQMNEYPSDVFPSSSSIMKRFGGINKFHILCGFEVSNKWSEMTNEEIIELSFEISPHNPISKSMLGAISRDTFPGVDFINRRFGSMTKFNKLRGFNKTDWSDITKDEIIALAQTLSPDKPMTQQIINNLSRDVFPSSDIVYNRFGSLRDFQEACGWSKVIDWQQYSNEDIISLAIELFLDKKFVVDSYEKGVFPGFDAIIRRFGTLDNFRRACGFEVKISWSEASNAEILETAKSLSPDKPLSLKDIESLSASSQFPSTSFIYNRFGSLVDFQRECGFDVKPKPDWSQYSKEDLLELSRELFQHSPLTQKDINEIDRDTFPSRSTIMRLFGSLEEFNRMRGLVE